VKVHYRDDKELRKKLHFGKEKKPQDGGSICTGYYKS